MKYRFGNINKENNNLSIVRESPEENQSERFTQQAAYNDNTGVGGNRLFTKFPQKFADLLETSGMRSASAKQVIGDTKFKSSLSAFAYESPSKTENRRQPEPNSHDDALLI